MLRKTVDALVYAGTLTGLVFGIGTVLGLIYRGNLVAAKRLLFLVGFLLLGYSAFQLRPTPLWERDGGGTNQGGGVDRSGDANQRERTRVRPRGIQALVTNAMPVSIRPVPDERLSVHAKLFVAALAMLFTSFLLEVAFSVGVVG